MCYISNPLPGEITVSDNFYSLEEAIDEIKQTGNIKSEREFFRQFEIRIIKL